MRSETKSATKLIGGVLIGISLVLLAVCGLLFFQGKASVAISLTVIGIVCLMLGCLQVFSSRAVQAEGED